MDEDATGMEVNLGPDHIVLDVVPAVHERGTAAPPLLAHVYCGHGRQSQLLLSSCFFSHEHCFMRLLSFLITRRFSDCCSVFVLYFE